MGTSYNQLSAPLKKEAIKEALMDLPNSQKRKDRRAAGGGLGPWLAKTSSAIN